VHFGPFRYCTKHSAKRAKLVQLMHKFRPRRLVRIFCNERSRSIPLDPKLMFWCVSIRSGAFWNSFATARNFVQNAPKLVQLMQKFVQLCLVRIFRTNAPDPHHWTLNSCFGVFLSVRVLFGLFRYCSKLGAKRAKLLQLIQIFMPRFRA